MNSTRIVLNQESVSGVEIPIGKFGSFIVKVESESPSGTFAVFHISASNHRGGSVMRTSSAFGKDSEHVTINWFQGENPKLKFSSLPVVSTKNITVIERDEFGNERFIKKDTARETPLEYSYAFKVSWI